MPKMFCTPLDVRAKNRILREQDRNGRILMDNAMLAPFVMEATGIILGRLQSRYSGYGAFETTPYTAPPQKAVSNEDGTGENTGTGTLMIVSPASTAETELWEITFTSTTAFTVSGTRSGSQGTGTTGTTFTSTNSDISIESGFWVAGAEGFVDGDKFYVPVYNNYPMIVAIATLLAAGLANQALYTEVAPNQNNVGTGYYEQGMKLLDYLADPTGSASLPSLSDANLDDLQVFYEITDTGYDVTGYKTDEYSRTGGQLTQITYPFWW